MPAFFYEHFLIAAPIPRTFQARGPAHFRIKRWYGTSSKVPWVDHCDCESNFPSRSYTAQVIGIIGNEDFLPSAHAHVSVAQAVINFNRMTLSGWLPIFCVGGPWVAVYRAYRVAG